MSELKQLSQYAKSKLAENCKLVQNLENFEVNEQECEISFIANISANDLNMLCEGLWAKYTYQNSDFKEKNKLKSNVKDYFKLYRKKSLIVRVDIYLNGSLQLTYYYYNLGSKRILKPVVPIQSAMSAFFIITEKNNGLVVEESFFNDRQILLHIYQRLSETVTSYKYVNFLSTVEVLPIQEFTEAKFTQIKKGLDCQILYKKGW